MRRIHKQGERKEMMERIDTAGDKERESGR
jgi:hypothetical protein